MKHITPSFRIPVLAALQVMLTIFLTSARADKMPLNVLMIIADDHAAYVCGAYGNKRAKTPNIDRLASSGMRFDRAYCNSPMCTASRQSFLTGRLPHSTGVTQLRTPLGDDPVTLAELLGPAGFRTAAIGKMHFNRKAEPGLHGFDLIYDKQQARQLVKKRGPIPVDSELAVQPPWKPFRDPARVWLNAANLPMGVHEPDMNGTIFADRAADFLKNNAKGPFFLMASFYQPHSPFYYPLEYSGRFDPEEFNTPTPGPEDDWQIPEIFRDLTADEIKGIHAAYYTSTAFMDRNVGRVLDALDENGLTDRTIVIYLGDHGYSLGQHGRIEKHCFYEPAVRSPLIIRWPGVTKPGSSTEALVELIDIFPTIAEICGATVPPAVGGKSLVPVLRGETHNHRRSVFSEYTENEEAMIRNTQFKLVYTTGKRERQDGYKTGNPLPGRTIRLFDTIKDPKELRDLSRSSQHQSRISRMLRLMTERLLPVDPDAAEIKKLETHQDKLDRLLVPPEER